MSTKALWQVLEAASDHPSADGDVCRAAREELVALEADNAALVHSLDEVVWRSTETVDGANAHDAATRLRAQPHPGAALLGELKSLRAEVDFTAEALEGLTAGMPLRDVAERRMEELRTARAQVEALGLEVQRARDEAIEETDRKASAVHEGLKRDANQAAVMKADDHTMAVTLGRVQGSFDVLFALRAMRGRR